MQYVTGAVPSGNPTTSFTIVIPTVNVGDLLLLEFTHRGTGNGSVSDNDTGGETWTRKGGGTYQAGAMSGHLYYKRATSGTSGKTITVTGLTNSCAAVLTVYRDEFATGDPFEDFTAAEKASGTESDTVSVATANAFACVSVHNTPDLSVTATSPVGIARRQEHLSTGGTDTSVAHLSVERTSAGDVAILWSQTNAVALAISYAIKPASAVEYTDSGTVILALTVSGTDIQADEYTDSGTITLTLTPSGVDVYEKEPTLDSGTITLALTPSGTDELSHEYTDSGTVYLTLTVSVPGGLVIGQSPIRDDWNRANGGIDSTNYPNNPIGFGGGHPLIVGNQLVLGATESYSETVRAVENLNQDQEVGAEYISGANAGDWGFTLRMLNYGLSNVTCYRVAIVPGASTDEVQFQKITASGTYTVLGSNQTIPQIADGEEVICTAIDNRISLWLHDGSEWVEEAWVEDSSSPYLNGGYVGFYGYQNAGQEHIIDNLRSGNLTAVPGETAQFVDSGTIQLTLTPSGTDEYEAGSTEFLDSGTITLTFTVSAIEGLETVDTGTVNLLLTPSGTDERIQVDAGEIYLTLTASGTEVTEYADSDTATVTLTPSGTEEHTTYDSDQIYLTFTITATELHEAVEAATVDLRFTPSGVDEYTGTSHYTDEGTVPLTFTPSGTDTYSTTYVDADTIIVTLTPSGTEEHARVLLDSGTAILTLTPSGTDEHTFPSADSGTAILSLTPSGDDLHVKHTTDEGTVTLVLTPSGVEGTSLAFDLVSRAYLRWQSTTTGKNYTSWAFSRYTTTARIE